MKSASNHAEHREDSITTASSEEAQLQDQLHSLTPHHLPFYITKPGETGALMIVMGVSAMLLAAAAFSFADRRIARARLASVERMQRLADVAFEGLLLHDGRVVQDANVRFAELLGRDLRDIAVSCWITNFRQIRWAFDPEHIATRFREYRRVMDHWRRVLPVPLLITLGWILVVIGAVFWIMGSVGRPVAGRRYWF